MAEIIHDGFDWLLQTGTEGRAAALPKWDEGTPQFGNALIPARGNHVTGGNLASYGANSLEKAFTARTRLFTGGAVHINATTSTLTRTESLGIFRNNTTKLFTITTETDYSFGLRSGDYDGTLIAKTAANTISHGLAWEYFEFEIVISATVGVFRVWKEGVLLQAFTGLNTGSTSINTFQVFSNNIPSGILDPPAYYVCITDFYLIDTVAGNGPVDRVGDSEMLVVFPNAAGAFSDFTPSAGSNWQNVDDHPHDSDTTRNTSSTVGHKDRYGFTDLPDGFTARVISVTHGYTLRKNDAGARTATGVIRGVGGTEVQDISRGLTTEYQGFAHTIWSDPDGSGLLLDNPNIVTICNGLQAGPEILT